MKTVRAKMAKAADLAQHIHTFNKIISDLFRIDIKFDDENKAMMLLSSLPASYEHLVTTLLWGKETLEFEEISGALLDHYQQKQNSGESFGEGLMVKDNQECGREKHRNHSFARGHSRSKSKSKTVKCYKCQKKGHIKRDCPKWKRGKDKDKEGLSRSANIVVADSDSDGDMLFVSSSANRLIDSWVLDLACSFHVTPHKDWFDTY